MPKLEAWLALPELRVLAEIAFREKFTFALRGSAAQVLADAYAMEEQYESLLEAMPPLSDIDFVVDHKAHAYALAAALVRELPATRFFRVDIRTVAELAHYQEAPLVVTGQPQIRFGEPALKSNEVAVSLRKGTLYANIGHEFMGEPHIIVRDQDIEPRERLNNLIWLGRRCPYDQEACKRYSVELSKVNPRRMAEQLRGKPLRKLLFDLVKLLLQVVADRESKVNWIDHELLARIAEEREHAGLNRIVRLLHEPPDAVVAVVVPRRHRNRWLSQVETVEPLTGTGGSLKLTTEPVANEETAFQVIRRLPPARVMTDDPERPGCCRYRDFSRGVAEVAWAGPVGPQGERLALVTSGDEFFLAPSVATSRKRQHEVKVDYGFLCQLRGARGPVDVHYGGVDDVK